MANDSTGQELAAGDRLTVTYEVKSVSPGERSFVSLKAISDAEIDPRMLPTMSCHSVICTKVQGE